MRLIDRCRALGRHPFIAKLERMLRRMLVGIVGAVVLVALVLTMLWRDRTKLDELSIPELPAAKAADTVTVTWFGVTTLLFDDGRTQILIDGFISRPSLFDIVARRRVDNDAATINYFLNEQGLRRLAAVIPVHSHFDHAMDVGAIANRTSASILGSETTANIARGARVREDQIVVVEDGSEYSFGDFTVRFVRSTHAPVGWRGGVPLPGKLEEPLLLPAPVTAFPAGESFSLIVSHPAGTALVQGSAGYREAALDGVAVDTVFMGVALLESLGREYMRDYWREMVTVTGARNVVPVHFDDYTQPFGRIFTAPRFFDDFGRTMRLLDEIRSRWDTDSRLFLPRFGVPSAVYPAEDPEA